MCRFAAYLGHPLLISQLVTEPKHSIIHQSYHSEERSTPTNADGTGIAWYVPHLSQRPAVFKDVRPAWNDENLLEIARVSVSHCIFAHVRAASPHSAVQRLNCHPFTSGNLAFMHNGVLGGFHQYRRQLLAGLSTAAFRAIEGSTDSEHAFAVLLDHYHALPALNPADRLAESLQRTLDSLEAFRAGTGSDEQSACNFAVTDGTCIVASRWVSAGAQPAPSLYYTTGRSLQVEDGQYELNYHQDHEVVLIASERLNADPTWTPVPPGTMLIAQNPGIAEVRPIRAWPSPAADLDPSGRLLPRG